VSVKPSLSSPSLPSVDDQVHLLPNPVNQVTPGWLTKLMGLLGKRLHAAERALCIEEQVAVGGKKSVTLIVCHGRRFLLASSGDAIAPLIEVQPLTRRSAQAKSKE
jgi:flagellar biogenesis protein FliO